MSSGGGAPDSTDELPIGIMQGRLTPSNGRGIQFFPFGDWENEFSLGKEIGLDEIEWIFDYERHEENPLWTESGCQSIKAKVDETSVKVHSVCFDYFMRRPFYKGKGTYEENTAFFSRALAGMERIGASLIEVPLVDDSSIQTAEEWKEALRFARDMADRAAQKKWLLVLRRICRRGLFGSFWKI